MSNGNDKNKNLLLSKRMAIGVWIAVFVALVSVGATFFVPAENAIEDKNMVETEPGQGKRGSIIKKSDVTVTGDVGKPEQELQYQQACKLMNEKKFNQARAMFIELHEYKDSKEKLAEMDGIIATARHNVGIISTGKVIAGEFNESGQCDVGSWENIKMVSTKGSHTVGLTENGGAVATGFNEFGQKNISDWKDLRFITAGRNHTVGIKNDGSVIAEGRNLEKQCNIFGWENIAVVSCGWRHTVGLKKDGTVIAVGDNKNGQCNVAGFPNFGSFACRCGCSGCVFKAT